jgi:hypothetical protein
MNFTALLWLTGFVVLTILALSRPLYGLCLYFMVFFATPSLWWWGKDLPETSWSLYSSFVLLGSVLLKFGHARPPDPSWVSWSNRLCAAMLVNALFVHTLLSPHGDVSYRAFELIAKFSVLYFLINRGVLTRLDFRALMIAIILGGMYIGYEAAINKRGKQRKGRMEGIGAPGASTANDLACLMVTILPMAGAMVFVGGKWERIMAVCASPFLLDVVLRCNSRGAFLAMGVSAVMMVISAQGKLRYRAILGIILGGVALFIQLGDQRIIERFMTTFAEQEERDTSAESRLLYWKAGLRMAADYPLGQGGGGFKVIHGPKYILQVGGTHFEARSVHNGYINDACEWGIQGLALRLAFIFSGMYGAYKTMKHQLHAGDPKIAFLGAAIIAGLSAFMVASTFGDMLDAEWAFWMVAISCCYSRFYGPLYPISRAQPAPAPSFA